MAYTVAVGSAHVLKTLLFLCALLCAPARSAHVLKTLRIIRLDPASSADGGRKPSCNDQLLEPTMCFQQLTAKSKPALGRPGDSSGTWLSPANLSRKAKLLWNSQP